MLESVGFVSSNVRACVIFGASPGRGRGLWGCVKGLLIKKIPGPFNREKPILEKI